MRIRHSFITGRRMFACVAASAMAGSAMARQPLDFDFQHLDSAFDTSTSILSVSAVNHATLRSGGFVRRNDPPIGTAVFLPGFVGGLDPSNFRMSLLITTLTPTTALASGSMMITDVDGDDLSALISGTFDAISGGGNLLSATITNVGFTTDEEYFDGPDGGTFSTQFAPGVLSSGTMQLNFVLREVLPFDRDFEGADTSVVGVIPAPSGAAALALAGLAAARRRRP